MLFVDFQLEEGRVDRRAELTCDIFASVVDVVVGLADQGTVDDWSVEDREDDIAVTVRGDSCEVFFLR